MQTISYAMIMAVMARESWTDERLDDLKAEMSHRFDAVDQRFDSVDQRFEVAEARMTEGFSRVDADIRELRFEMKEMQRTMSNGFMTLSGTMFIGFAAVIGLLAV